MKKIVLIISSFIVATDVPVTPVAPIKSTTQSKYEARKARAAKKQEVKLQKYEARLEKGRKRVEAKGLIPKTARPDNTTGSEMETPEPVNIPATESPFSQEIESIFNRYLQTETDKTLPIDSESYDVSWDGNAASLKGIIDQLEHMEVELAGAIQRAQAAKKLQKLVDKDLIDMGLTNIEAFADDSLEDVPYSGAKGAYKTKLVALSNNISSIRADLFNVSLM